MKVIFAGTPDFAAAALKAIAAAGFEIPLVLTQPDRPKGRGMQLTASPVKQAALELGLTVAQPEKLRNNAEALQMLKDCLLYTSPSPRDTERSRMPSSA